MICELNYCIPQIKMADNEGIAEFLFEAIYNSELEAVEAVVNHYGLSYCQEWAEGYELLCLAVLTGDEQIVKFLAEKGAKVFVKNQTYDTYAPLHTAVAERSLELVETLINTNALVDVENECFSLFPSLFRIAAERGDPDIFQCVLNGAGNYCSTYSEFVFREPLLIACNAGFIKIAEILIDFRAQKELFSLKPLHVALVLTSNQGSEDLVSALLNASADPNAVLESHDIGPWSRHLWDHTRFPLHLACVRGHLGVVKLLLRHGANLNCSREKDNYTPLHLACAHGHVEIVSHLLNNGADPNAIAIGDESPSHVAAQIRGPWVQHLSLLSTAIRNYTPLHLACAQGHVEIVSHLLNNGADANAKAIDDESPLHIVAQIRGPLVQQLKLIELLINSGANINGKTFHGSTPLLLAAEHTCAEVTKILLKHGASVNIRDDYGKTPLDIAVSKVDSSMVYLFLQHNCEVDDYLKKKVIDMATNCFLVDGPKMINNFFEYGPFFNREDVSDPELLQSAVIRGYIKVVECILNYGLDRKDTILNPTLLHKAVKYGRVEVIELLLKSGHNINAIDEEGNTPIHYSMNTWDRKKWVDIFQILLANGAVVKDASGLLCEAVDKGNFEVCNFLIENINADANAINSRGETLLLILASKKDYSNAHHETEDGEKKIDDTARAEIAKLLLSKGADPHFVTEHGDTALHIAALNGNTETVRALLHFGAYVNSRGKKANFWVKRCMVVKPVKDGWTALHGSAQEGYAEVVKVLLEFDADINIREGSMYEYALHGAVSRNHDEVVRVLLENGCDINIENMEGKTALDLAIREATSSFDYQHRYANHVEQPFGDLVEAPINPEDHVVSNLLKMHAIKLKVAGLHVSDKILQQVESTPFLVDFQRECEKELRKLKNEKFGSLLTLYDILVDSKNPAYVRNESLNSNNYPVYGSLIVNNVEKNKRRIKLLTSGQESLRVLMKTYSSLNGKESPVVPDEVLEEILSYLTNRELRALILTGEGLKNQLCK